MGRPICVALADTSCDRGMTLTATATELPGVLLLAATAARDSRGSITRLSCVTTLVSLQATFTPRQVSVSRSIRCGTLRGLHFQIPPSEETKVVHCITGAVFDVVVDLRRDSPSFCRAVCTRLSEDDNLGVMVPPGCAHGLITLTDHVAVLYQMNADYDPACARGVRWNDPAFDIPWPCAPTTLSPRDATWPDFVP